MRFGNGFWRGLAAWVFLFAAAAQAAETRAIFVAVGDQHSAYARTAQFVAHVDRLKRENPTIPFAVLIDGDVFEQGNVVAKRSAGVVDFAMMAALARRAPTIVNLGNHEPEFFDVAATVARIQATGAIAIGNLAEHATGELFAPASTRLRLGEMEFVVAGLSTDALAQYRAAIRPSLDLSVPAIWARERFPEIFQNAPLKIIMSHAGLRLDRDTFPYVPDGTLFVAAHDHTQFIQRLGNTVYLQSGSWNSHFSIARLVLDQGAALWQVEQTAIRETDPADPELTALIRETLHENLKPEDLRPVGETSTALTRTDAALFVVEAVRRAAGVDAAFIGNTTFGDGLPAGAVSRVALDACVRFDGSIWVAEISGARLQQLMAAANQSPDTPFDQRQGEYQFAAGPKSIAAEKTYRIATNDWGVNNRARYFGAEEIWFIEKPGLRLKAILASALVEDDRANK